MNKVSREGEYIEYSYGKDKGNGNIIGGWEESVQ